MIIALASPRVATSLDDGLAKVERLVSDAASRGAEIVCFPEAYLPGLRGQDFDVLPYGREQETQVLGAATDLARTHSIAIILGMEKITTAGRQIAACVIDAAGEIQGFQTKNQLDPTEDRFYVPGTARQLFEVNGTKFGIAICHEGWRYPETVRWAAVRGAKIGFHPPHASRRHERSSLLREGDDDAEHREHDLLRERQLRAAVPGVGDGADFAGRYPPGLPAVR